MRFQVATVQFAPQKNRVQENLDRIAQLTLQASNAGADVVVFPEASTSGYFLEGGTMENSLTQDELLHEVRRRLANHPRDVDLVIGFYESRDQILYNSAAYVEVKSGQATIRNVYRKFFLATYAFFDEERFVSAGNSIQAFQTRFGMVGSLICEDVWHSIAPTLLALQGAQVIYVPSASPARGFEGELPGNVERYQRLLKGIAEEHAVYVAHSMLTGFEGGKGFAGHSSIVDPEGVLLAKSPILEEHILMAEVDLQRNEQARAQSPLINDLKSRWGTLLRIASDIH